MKPNQGQTLIEILVTISILSLIILPILFSFSQILRASNRLLAFSKSAHLSQNTMEILTHIANPQWEDLSSLNPNTPYSLTFTGDSWQFDEGQEKTALYQRSLIISPTCRNSQQEITDCYMSNTTEDSNSRLITVVTTVNSAIAPQITSQSSLFIKLPPTNP